MTKHEGDAEFSLQALQFDLHCGSELSVEGRQWFVQKQHRGPVDDGAGQRHALLLAAGHLVNTTCGEATKADQFQRLDRATVDLAAVDPWATLAKPIGDVRLDVEMRKQGVVLEHHVYRALVGRHAVHGLAVDEHCAFAGLFEAADHAEARGLTAARRAEQGNESALWHAEVDGGYGLHLAVALADGEELDVIRRSP